MNWALEIIEILALIGSVLWIAILFLPWRPWSTKESLDTDPSIDTSKIDLSNITALIPARNEADVLIKTLSGLAAQGSKLRVVVVDDQSTDGTSKVAYDFQNPNLQIRSIRGTELPQGWAGKLWALEQGRRYVQSDYILLLDADIELSPGILPSLRNHMIAHQVGFASLMAHLRMESFWEKLLMPSFIYFFKLMYPFKLGNNPQSKIAVAAGGCILMKTEILEQIGGFGSIQGALIDDCSLARKVKMAGVKTWMGLTHSVTSHRHYDSLSTIWNMVARSAYTQLHYSVAFLLITSLIMKSMFVYPALAAFFVPLEPLNLIVLILGAVAMIASYIPTLRYYGRNPLWALALPVIGVLYLLMTWTSATRYWTGKKSQWKGRVYHTALESSKSEAA